MTKLSLSNLLQAIDPNTPLSGPPALEEGDIIIWTLDPFQRQLAALTAQLVDQITESQTAQAKIRKDYTALELEPIKTGDQDAALQALELAFEEQRAEEDKLNSQLNSTKQFLSELIASDLEISGMKMPEHGVLIKGDGSVVACPTPEEDPRVKQFREALSGIFGSLFGSDFDRPDCGNPDCPGCSARRKASENKEEGPAQTGPVAGQEAPPSAEVQEPVAAEKTS